MFFHECFFLYMKMVNKYSQKHKEKLRKEAHEKIKMFLNEKKTKGHKRPGKGVKILLENKKKKASLLTGN